MRLLLLTYSYFSKGMIESPGTGWRESGLGVAGIQKYMISKTIFVNTTPASPYFVELAIAIASSSVSNGVTHTTGPKISSWKIVISGVTSANTVTGTKYGLAGGVFTKDIKRGLRVAQAIDSGQIYVNSYFSKGMIESPGTGWRESGLGVAGIQKYMISKTIFVDTEDGSVPY